MPTTPRYGTFEAAFVFTQMVELPLRILSAMEAFGISPTYSYWHVRPLCPDEPAGFVLTVTWSE